MEIEDSVIKLWLLSQIEESMQYIRLDKEWISTLNEFREKYQNNWRIVEACRELIFYHVKDIQEEAKEIERVRKVINQPG